jgi:uncharacterized Ntn-hydrolase superfamily protein
VRQSPAMRLLLLVVALSGCKSSSKPAATQSGDYCRGEQHLTETPLLGTQTGSSVRPAHTFSVVARDPVTGDIGVAVQSHYFSVGSVVTWAEPGVGAVATQSFVDPRYGAKGIELMRGGTPAPDALAKLLADDKTPEVRQVAMVDAQGRVNSHTGAKCIAFASSHVGNQYAVQANIMANDKVVPAMAAAYESTKGDLTERLLATLEAAQAAGGDLRGCQSAAILVVSGTKNDTPWKEKKIDLRVEDSANPLKELRRLVVLARAYDQMNQGDLAVEKNDIDGAAAHYAEARKIVPDNAEMTYWTAVALASKGKVDDTIPMFKQTFKDDPAWIEMTRRMVPAGLLPQAAAERVLREAR